MLGVVAVVVLLVAIPAMRKSLDKTRRIGCVSRLKNIGLSYRIFATDNQNLFPWEQGVTNGTMAFTNRGEAWRHFAIISNEVSTPLILRCPADRERDPAESFNGFGAVNLSYFASLSGRETAPQGLLAGDRNILVDGQERPGEVVNLQERELAWTRKIHKYQGNVTMGDGSVMQLTTERLRELNLTEGVTNVVMFP